MLDKLFRNNSSITTENVDEKAVEYAGQLGLNRGRLRSCMKDEKIEEKVQANQKEGLQVGVRSTPTFIVNGRRKRGFSSFDSIKSLIDEKLKEAKK